MIPNESKKMIIYGAGLTGAIAKIWLEDQGYKCLYFIDDHKSKIENIFCEIKILSLSNALKISNQSNIIIFIASINYQNSMENKLRKFKFLNYKIFYSESCIIDRHQKNHITTSIDDDLTSKVESLFSNEYSKSLYKKIVNYKKLNAPYFLNIHDQYFSYYTPKANDVIFDCGAGIGVFTQKALSYLTSGKIYIFEPDPHQFEILFSKFSTNGNIILVNKGVYNLTSNLFFTDNRGSGSNRIDQSGTKKILVTAIDSFVRNNNIKNVNFIKMDIEGAELRAIKGAKNIINEFKPALAICIYHKTEDLWTIPLAIKDIRDDYQFFLEHHSIGMGETVLYAV